MFIVILVMTVFWLSTVTSTSCDRPAARYYPTVGDITKSIDEMTYEEIILFIAEIPKTISLFQDILKRLDEDDIVTQDDLVHSMASRYQDVWHFSILYNRLLPQIIGREETLIRFVETLLGIMEKDSVEGLEALQNAAIKRVGLDFFKAWHIDVARLSEEEKSGYKTLAGRIKHRIRDDINLVLSIFAINMHNIIKLQRQLMERCGNKCDLGRSNLQREASSGRSISDPSPLGCPLSSRTPDNARRARSNIAGHGRYKALGVSDPDFDKTPSFMSFRRPWVYLLLGTGIFAVTVFFFVPQD